MEGVYIKIRIYLCPWHYCEPKELGEYEVFVKKKSRPLRARLLRSLEALA